MTNWQKCTWRDEATRPTIPGVYRVLIEGFDDPNAEDFQMWAELHKPHQDYKLPDNSRDIWEGMIPDGEPYSVMVVEHGEEEENIIAWFGPIHIPDERLWQPCDPEKTETWPPVVGHYRVLIVGDSETEGPHVYYEYDDYTVWAEVKDVDPEDYIIRCEFDEELDQIISWYGPINAPEMDCF